MAAVEQNRRSSDKPALPPTDELIKQFGNKSRAIRSLSADGYSRSQIANALKIRYQHVRNVLMQPVKKSSGDALPTESEEENTPENNSKSPSRGTSKKH